MNFTENLSKIKKLDSEKNDVIYSERKRKAERQSILHAQQNIEQKIKMEELKRLKENAQPRMSFAKNTYRKKVVELNGKITKFINDNDDNTKILKNAQLLYKLNKRYDHVTSKVNPEISPTPLIKLKKELIHDSVELDMADTNVE